MAAVARVPFGELSTAVLQQASNRHHGLIAHDASAKPSVPTPAKRSYAMSSLSEDSENVDPIQFSSSKKSKFELFSTPSKPLSFSKPAFTITAPRFAGMASPVSKSAPRSAPAGRSPRKNASKSRAFTRIDPPFATSNALPFSLDAALNGSLGKKRMPAKWDFEIHVDTPDEEAGILMEHSTLTLDLSSDDENVTKNKGLGKENVAPEGHLMPTSGRGRSVKATDIVRKKIETDQMDDGQRTPLSDLEVEPFNVLEEGEDKYIVVDAETSTDFTFSVPAIAPTVVAKNETVKLSAVEGESVKIYEDEPPTKVEAAVATGTSEEPAKTIA